MADAQHTAVILSATATIDAKLGTAEITPEPMQFDNVAEALEALSVWAGGEFSPVIDNFRKLEVKIEVAS